MSARDLARLVPVALLAGLCACGDWPWPMDNPNDQLRCDPACGKDAYCQDGRCVTSYNVQGKGTRHCLGGDGEITQPVDFADWQVAALVPPTWSVSPGTTGVGSFTIPGVPVGAYYLQVQDGLGAPRYYVRNSPTIDLSVYALGRPDAVAPTQSTRVTLNATNLKSWQADDFLQLVSANAGTVILVLEAYATAGAPTQGDTALTGFTFDLYEAAQDGWTANLVQGSKGDVALVSQLVTKTSGTTTYHALDRIFTAPNRDWANGASITLSGSFAQVPQDRTLTVSWLRSAFDAHRASINPSAVNSTNPSWFGVWSLPKAASQGAYGSSPDLAETTTAGPTTDVTLTLQYGNPFGSPWEEVISAQAWYEVKVQAPGASASTQYLLMSGGWPVSALTATLAPTVSPVQDLTINGQNAFQQATGTTATPTVAWRAPAVGAPSGYWVTLMSVSNVAGDTEFQTLASFLTADTQLAIPPGLLHSGQPYLVVVAAELRSGVDVVEQPYLSSGTAGWAEAISAVMSP